MWFFDAVFTAFSCMIGGFVVLVFALMGAGMWRIATESSSAKASAEARQEGLLQGLQDLGFTPWADRSFHGTVDGHEVSLELSEALSSVCAGLGRRLELAPESVRALTERHWRGNVRELRNCLERAAILVDGHRLGPSDFGESTMQAAAAPEGAVATMEEVERQAIERALLAFDGNRKQAAEALGIGVRTLYDKLKRIEQE